MCRFTIILKNDSNNFTLQEIKNIFWYTDHSLFKQCYKNPYTPEEEDNVRNNKINLDGYGLGYYSNNIPIIYRNTIPSWNDTNLIYMLPNIHTSCLMIHIRAVTPIITNNELAKHIKHSPVSIHNCHPFQHNQYIFCHNGIVEAFYVGHLKKKILNEISDDLITELNGSTDSEAIFFLLISLINKNKHKDNGIITSFKQLIQFLNNLSNEHISSLNLCLTDGNNIYATKYISNNKEPPSLYLCMSYNNMVTISSEPISKKYGTWISIEKNSLIHINKTQYEIYNL